MGLNAPAFFSRLIAVHELYVHLMRCGRGRGRGRHLTEKHAGHWLMGLRAPALLSWLIAGTVLYSCTVQNLHGHLRSLPAAYLTYSLLYLQPTLPTPSPITTTTTTTTTITTPQPFLFKPSPASLGLWKVEGARPSSARTLRARRSSLRRRRCCASLSRITRSSARRTTPRSCGASRRSPADTALS